MVRFLCDFAMPVLGGLPRKKRKRKTSLRTWSAPILLGILISSSCKPLTLLQNLVKSDVWTRVSLSKMLCSNFFKWCLNRNRVLGQTACGSGSWLLWASYEFWMTWEHWASSTFLHCVCVKRAGCHCAVEMTVPSGAVWPGASQEPGGSPQCCITETCACTMNQGWDVLWWIAVLFFCLFVSFFFSTFCVGCPSPQRRIRDMELLSIVNPVPK